MNDKSSFRAPSEKKKETPEIKFPNITEIPDPPVPNRAHTEMVLGSDGRSGLSDASTDRIEKSH